MFKNCKKNKIITITKYAMTQINFGAEAQSVFFLFYTPRLSNKFIRRKLFGGMGEKKGFGELLIP